MIVVVRNDYMIGDDGELTDLNAKDALHRGIIPYSAVGSNSDAAVSAHCHGTHNFHMGTNADRTAYTTFVETMRAASAGERFVDATHPLESIVVLNSSNVVDKSI